VSNIEELKKRAKTLDTELIEISTKLGIDESKLKLDELRSKSEEQDFWADNLSAQKVMKQISKLEQKVEPWLELSKKCQDLNELTMLNDSSMLTELDEQAENISSKINELKEGLKLNGPYDDHDAIISIFAGAGGTDAQDWAQMLYRMYVRWAEKNNLKVELIDQTTGEEAGIKSLTMELSGLYAYGKLKGEHGVHRLVRLSPFNSDNLRQTSFAKVDVLPKIDQVEELVIDDKDLRIDVYRSGGHGGQSVNTTDSAVRITHIPTNISVAIQNERSQTQNKELAMTVIRSKLAQLQLEQHTEKLAELKGPTQSAEWGNQIRSYVLHPYKQVKDLRTGFETSEPDKILDGDLDGLIEAYLEYSLER
jgi:peptide chain release factor 2